MDYVLLMLSSAGDALIIMADPMRLLFLFGGVVIGLPLGVIPGLGGLVGMALLLPFTFDMDKFAAFAFLSPKLVRAILEGRQPPELTTNWIRRHNLPASWAEQDCIVAQL